MLTTDKFSIKTLLEKIESGEIQLPDFQRDWVWEDKQIKALLESVIRGFPINSILLLEYDANNIKLSYILYKIACLAGIFYNFKFNSL